MRRVGCCGTFDVHSDLSAIFTIAGDEDGRQHTIRLIGISFNWRLDAVGELRMSRRRMTLAARPRSAPMNSTLVHNDAIPERHPRGAVWTLSCRSGAWTLPGASLPHLCWEIVELTPTPAVVLAPSGCPGALVSGSLAALLDRTATQLLPYLRARQFQCSIQDHSTGQRLWRSQTPVKSLQTRSDTWPNKGGWGIGSANPRSIIRDEVRLRGKDFLRICYEWATKRRLLLQRKEVETKGGTAHV